MGFTGTDQGVTAIYIEQKGVEVLIREGSYQARNRPAVEDTTLRWRNA
ncbi:MAG: hypothetical protein ACFFD4_18090 [Candidatus Odinarchaeota archaeon]